MWGDLARVLELCGIHGVVLHGFEDVAVDIHGDHPLFVRDRSPLQWWSLRLRSHSDHNPRHNSAYSLLCIAVQMIDISSIYYFIISSE